MRIKRVFIAKPDFRSNRECDLEADDRLYHKADIINNICDA
jgi:hypothetical protein